MVVKDGMKPYSHQLVKPYDVIVYKKDGRVYAVDKFGEVIAKGESDVDDTTVILSTISYLNELCSTFTEGKTLYIDSGTYLISSEITISYPHRIIGAGPSQTILKCTNNIILFNINPTSGYWFFVHFSLENMTLDGNTIGTHGITYNELTGNGVVTKSYYENLVIKKFTEFGVVENSCWGSVYVNVVFKSNGVAAVPPNPITVNSGGICIYSNCNYFYGCAFEWNTCGLVFRNGYGSCLYGCVIEGNVYHGIYAYATVESGWHPQHITIDGAQFELNGIHNQSYPGYPETLYDIYIVHSTVSFWAIKNCKTSGSYVTESVLSNGQYTTVLNYRCMDSPSVLVPGAYSFIDSIVNSSSIGDYTTVLTHHNHRLPANIIIYKIGSTCYAKDGTTGKILSSSSTDQTVFSYVFANAPAGSHIYIKRGTYSISSTLFLANHGICIYGESKIGGGYGTILQLTESSINIELSTSSQLHRIAIDANSKTCRNASVIFIGQNSSYVTLDDIYVYGCGSTTACVYVYETGHTGGCIIQNSKFVNSYYPCIMVGEAKGGGIINILNNVIACNYSSNEYGSGIYISNSQNCVVKNNTINGTCKYGVYLCWSSNQNIVSANVITNTVTAAIAEDGTAQNNIITNNIVAGYSITTSIGKSLISDNIGYVHPLEITDNICTVLDALGSPRLLSPFTNISGTSITDYSRYSNTLTSTTTVGSLYGYQNKATYYDLNGSSHYLYRTNDTDFDFGNATTDSAFSVVCCLNPDAVDSRFIIGKWDENNAREWRLFLNASGYPTFQLYDESADTYIGRVDSASFGTGTWKVLIATYNGSGISAGCKLYIDGVQVDDADYASGTYVAMEAVSAYLMVGAKKNASSYSEYYDGKMTWIGITAKELSADEVWSLTQRLKGVLGV